MQRESITVLEECIDLQKRKSMDYQNPNSNIVQAMHYRRGLSSIHDMISQKLLRAQSLIEPMENGETNQPNFESIEDTYKDLINYASFAVSYIRGKMEGQDITRDMFNRRKSKEELNKLYGSIGIVPTTGINYSTESTISATIQEDGTIKIDETIKDVYDRIDEDILDLQMNVIRNNGTE